MYNLFVTAVNGAWDQAFYEYDRSRFLEYTREDVAERFKGLSESQIDELKSLPCLFAYEGSGGGVRVGRLTAIKERGRSILIEYEFLDKIGDIPFDKIAPISVLLDIRDWEMNRTHWAVKDEDLFSRLIKASIVGNEFYGWPGVKSQHPRSMPPAPNVEAVTNVQKFIQVVLDDEIEENREVFYRGHSDKRKYKLEPSLFRRDELGNYMYLHNEHILYRELIVANAEDFEADVYTLDRLVRMQHYSLPTRLLDITSNPLIALYFTCKSKFLPLDGQQHAEEEGEVIVFSIKRDQVKYFDSDTASCISNLARLPKAEKDKIDFSTEGIEQFNKQVPIRRLCHLIQEEKSFFEDRIDPADLQRIVCVKSKRNNSRIHSQSGAFLLFGLDAVLDEKGTPEIDVKRITIKNKASILKELDHLNINESTVFPYIETSARYVAAKYAFKAPKA